MSEQNQAAGISEMTKFESMSFGMIPDRAIHLYVKIFGLLIWITVIPQVLIFINGVLLGISVAG